MLTNVIWTAAVLLGSRRFLLFFSSLSDADPMKSNVIGFNNFLVTCMDYNMFDIAATNSFLALWRSVLHEQLWNVETDKVNVGLWFW